jgi:hypothetical protein
VTATAVQTSSRLESEPGGEVFVFRRATVAPPERGAPPARRSHHIFDSTVHGSPSAPVRFGIDAHHRTTNHHSATKGTA